MHRILPRPEAGAMDRDHQVIQHRTVLEPFPLDLSSSTAKRRAKLMQMIARGEAISAELIAFAAAARARIAAIGD
jgi:hypothetical protein